jgi:hypothetical protein
MAQSRNPSERNKVGEKQKKKQAWWESALNAAGDFATGLGETTIGNLSKVGQFGGNLVKGTIVDPVAWAINNPDEVAKTFVSPERANEWIYDNLFAGEELDRIVQGNAGLADAAIAAMALFPVGKISNKTLSGAAYFPWDEVEGRKFVKNRLKGIPDDGAIPFLDTPPPPPKLSASELEKFRREVIMKQMQQLFPDEFARATKAKNPYNALDSVLYRLGKRGEEIAQAQRGGLINANTGEVNRLFESPIENIGGTRSVTPQATGAENYALQRPIEPSYEADALMASVAEDIQRNAFGVENLPDLIYGQSKMQMNAATAMDRAKAVMNAIEKRLNELPRNSPEYKTLNRQRREYEETVLVPLQKDAAKKRKTFAEPKRQQEGYESKKGK